MTVFVNFKPKILIIESVRILNVVKVSQWALEAPVGMRGTSQCQEHVLASLSVKGSNEFNYSRWGLGVSTTSELTLSVLNLHS